MQTDVGSAEKKKKNVAKVEPKKERKTTLPAMDGITAKKQAGAKDASSKDPEKKKKTEKKVQEKEARKAAGIEKQTLVLTPQQRVSITNSGTTPITIRLESKPEQAVMKFGTTKQAST